jgi:hypothetical protein
LSNGAVFSIFISNRTALVLGQTGFAPKNRKNKQLTNNIGGTR